MINMIGVALTDKHPLLKRFGFFIVVPATIIVAGVFSYLRSSLPAEGTKTIKQANHAVAISNDAHGVPTIIGRTDRDVFFGMGYVHARDRMWQLEVQRRIARGRLSEIFGAGSLKQDIWLRTLGIYESSRQSYAALTPEARASLLAYAEGVNQWLGEHHTLPPEFLLLGVEPAPWDVLDSLSWVKIFSLSLSSNFNSEIAHYFAAQSLSAQQMKVLSGAKVEFATTLPALRPAQSVQFAALGDVQQSLEASYGLGGKFAGSNAWVVAKRLSSEHAAMLSNDPHLGLQMPSLWYAVSQQGDRLRSGGMSLVGLPLVIFGRNARIAWGGTSLPADVQDLYFERVDPKNPGHYLSGGQWERFSIRKERIEVRSDFPSFLRPPLKPVDIEVRTTGHGPVISDAVGLGGQAVSLQWTGLEQNDTTYEAFLRLNYASDWASFRQALRPYVAPTLNMLYGDDQGNIGATAIGRIPVRSRGNGSMPSDGASGAYGWTSYIAFDDLPHSYNPERGYIVSANQEIVDAAYPHFISAEWAPASRATRIASLLAARLAAVGKVSPQDAMRMQSDVLSLSAVKIMPRLRQVAATSPRQRQALALLQEWDGRMSPDSQAAALYQVWMRHLRLQVFSQDKLHSPLPREARQYYANMVDKTTVEDLMAALDDRSQAWCANRGNAAGPSPASCDQQLLASLDSALDELHKLRGSDAQSWTWGALHRTVYSHQPFSNVKLLDSLFQRSIPAGGSTDSINVANSVYVEGDGYHQTFGAGFRQVISMRPGPAAHWYMNTTGQSGNVFSKHYSDMIRPFQRGEYLSLPQLPGRQANVGPDTASGGARQQ